MQKRMMKNGITAKPVLLLSLVAAIALWLLWPYNSEVVHALGSTANITFWNTSAVGEPRAVAGNREIGFASATGGSETAPANLTLTRLDPITNVADSRFFPEVFVLPDGKLNVAVTAGASPPIWVVAGDMSPSVVIVPESGTPTLLSGFPSIAGLTIDAAHHPWMSEPLLGAISRYDPSTNIATRFVLGVSPGTLDQALIDELFFTVPEAPAIGRLNTSTMTATIWPIPGTQTSPFDPATRIDASGGAVLATTPSSVVQLTPATNQLCVYDAPAMVIGGVKFFDTGDIVSGPNGIFRRLSPASFCEIVTPSVRSVGVTTFEPFSVPTTATASMLSLTPATSQVTGTTVAGGVFYATPFSPTGHLGTFEDTPIGIAAGDSPGVFAFEPVGAPIDFLACSVTVENKMKHKGGILDLKGAGVVPADSPPTFDFERFFVLKKKGGTEEVEKVLTDFTLLTIQCFDNPKIPNRPNTQADTVEITGTGVWVEHDKKDPETNERPKRTGVGVKARFVDRSGAAQLGKKEADEAIIEIEDGDGKKLFGGPIDFDKEKDGVQILNPPA